MKLKIFAAAFLFLLVSFSNAQQYKELKAQAESEFEKGNFEKAVQLMDQTLKAAANDKKVGRDELMEIKTDHGICIFYSGQIDDGLTKIENVISEINKTAVSPKTEFYIRKNYAALLRESGYYADALPQFESCYKILSASEISKNETAEFLTILGETYHFNYKFDEAETTFKEALTYCEKNSLTKTSEYATVFNSMALLYSDMLYEKKALENYRKAHQIYIAAGDTTGAQYAIFLMNYGGFTASSGNPQDAISILLKARKINLQLYGENSAQYAGVINNLAFAYNRTGRITETEQYYSKALDIKRSLRSGIYGDYLTGLNNLLFFYLSVGREPEAKELVEELEKSMYDKRFQDTLKKITFAENLAQYYSQRKQYIKATKYFNEANEYNKAIFGPGNMNSVNNYISMSVIQWQQNQKKEAAITLGNATEIISKMKDAGDRDRFTLYRNLGVTLMAFKMFKEAEPLIDEALKMTDAKKIIDPNDIADICLQKAQLSSELNKVKESGDYFKKYLDLKYGQMEKDFSYMTETEKMQFLDNLENAVQQFYTSVTNHVEKYPELLKLLLDFRLKTKGMLLNNVTKIRSAILESNDAELVARYEQLKLNRENISKLMSLNTDEYAAALSEVSALTKESELLEKELSQKVTAMKLTKVEAPDWKQIQKLLAPGECAIEVISSKMVYQNDSLGTNYTFIFIKPSGDPQFYFFDRTLSWENNILNSYRVSVENLQDDSDLYGRLWKGVAEKLMGVQTVYFSSDGVYNQINLNTLLNPETKKFLIDELNIHYVSSLRELDEIKSAKPFKPQNAVLVGNPSFGYDLTKLPENKEKHAETISKRGTFGFVLDPLPGTKTEVETINRELSNNTVSTTLLTEQNANEAEVKRLKNPDVLHFATHGFFLEDFSEETLSEYTKTEQAYYRNPMMRSGIFFSGANNTYSLNTANIEKLAEFEDGTLTAYEAMSLNLDKTELVVLSACQTGLGKVKNGEGVYGLQRAFKMAGAKSIIMSLWSVSDEATMNLMVNFYNNWNKSGDMYSAFRDAQLELRKKYPQSYYWGAFVLSGK